MRHCCLGARSFNFAPGTFDHIGSMAPVHRASGSKAAVTKSQTPRSAATTTTASNSRKRRQTDEDEQPAALTARVDSLGLGDGDKLEFGSDDDAGVDEDGELDGGSDDDGAEEPFPELDVEESDDDDDDDDESFDGSLGDDDAEDLDEDEAALLAEIEAEDAAAASSAEEEDGSDLDELIRRNTVKPNEDDVTPGTSWEDNDLPKDYMKRSRTVQSQITGQEKTQWDEEIDAGYGSDSSTEEVRTMIASG